MHLKRLKMDNLEKIFDEFAMECKKGEVKIEESIYNTKFNVAYNIEEIDNDLTLKIRDKKIFLSLLKDYIYLVLQNRKIENLNDNIIKEIITLLFSNASYIDFDDAILFLRKNIEFIKNPLENSQINNIEGLLNSDILIENNVQSLKLETPYSFDVSIVKDSNKYSLPKISYGIYGNQCYIYSIQNDTKVNENEYYKKIKRKLYKINDNILNNESKEYIDYKNSISSYYPENISDVSPSAVLALSIFIKELDKVGINKIEVVSFLPVRYFAKEKANYKRLSYKTKKEKLSFLDKLKEYKELVHEHDRIQSNITNKFIRNFYRLDFHLDGLEIVNYIDNPNDNLKININNIKCNNNVIINEVLSAQNLNIKNR